MSRSSNGRTGNIDGLQDQVSEVTTLLRDTVEKVVERGDRIDTLQARSEDLECSASHFKQGAGRLRRNMWWKNCKMTCIIILVVSIVLGVIITIILVETKPWENSSGGGHHHNGTRSIQHITVNNGKLPNS